MRTEPAFQSQLQLWQLAPQQPAPQLCQLARVLFARKQGPDHGPSGGAQRIAGHGGQLEIGILQHLLHAVSNAVTLLTQRDPVAGQVPQFANRLRRHKAALQQSVLQQFRQPRTVPPIGLLSRNGLNVLRIHQPQLELILQNVPHRLPVHARRLHNHVAHPAFAQPVGQRQQFAGKSPEQTLLLPISIGPQHAPCDRVLVHVQTTTAAVNYVHR